MFSEKFAYAVFGVCAVIMILMPVFLVVGKVYVMHLEDKERRGK